MSDERWGAPLPVLVAERAEKAPDEIMVYPVDADPITNLQFHEASLRWAGILRELGVKAGDPVVTMQPNRAEAYEFWSGVAWLRAIEVPLNNAYQGRLLAHAVRLSAARIAVITSGFIERFVAVADELPDLKVVVVPDAAASDLPDLPWEVVDKNQIEKIANIPGDLEPPGRHDVSCVIFTSGTTGPSKGVLVPWAELWTWIGVYPVTAPDSVVYNYYPNFHVSGKVFFLVPVEAGWPIVHREVFSVEAFWRDVRTYNCTIATILPPMIRFLLRQPRQPDDADNTMAWAGVLPLIPEVDEFKQRFGFEGIVTCYGMTEIGCVFGAMDEEITDIRSCGKLLDGYEVRVVNEHDEPLGPGEIGELIVRHDQPWRMNVGYMGMPDKTAEAWRNGWFHTGDGFMYDENGNYYFVDRFKDYIRRRGENISSFEVEAYVNEHPQVVESAAIAVPSEYGEDDVKVVVVLEDGSELPHAELHAWLKERMPKFMVPRFIEFTNELPKTEATVRTQKAKLRVDPRNAATWDCEAV